jgi:hypothetical protein
VNKYDLESAYRATEYRVFGSRETFVISIGERSKELLDILDRMKSSSWSFIAASNPRSQQISDAENDERLQNLEVNVMALGYRFLKGEGVSRHGDWPPEKSLLILGIDEESSMELAIQYGQNAFVFGRTNEEARLVWTPGS